MKTIIPTRLISPKVITSVDKNGSSLRFTYGDGTFEDIDLISLARNVQLEIESNYNEQIDRNMIKYVIINPSKAKDGDIKLSGNTASMQLGTTTDSNRVIQITK